MSGEGERGAQGSLEGRDAVADAIEGEHDARWWLVDGRVERVLLFYSYYF